jgi:ethanolamine transporter
MVKDMDQRGKVVNIAFAVSAAFVFGDHLGFTAGFAPEMLPSMIVGKLIGGLAAVALALWLTREE